MAWRTQLCPDVELGAQRADGRRQMELVLRNVVPARLALSPAAGTPAVWLDTLATEPARGLSYSAWLAARASGREWVFRVPLQEEGRGESAATVLQQYPTVGSAIVVPGVIVHDVNELTEKLFPIVEAMQKHFSAGSGTYYSDAIFFLSVAMHRIMPKEITQIIQVDLDLKYKTNIRDLFDEFNNFPEGAVIGIAREMQPVYRHTFWQYRRENPQTKVGDPPPDGLPGFNSGVLLLNLEAMRQSKLYNQLLEPTMVQKLTEKYHFKGHLGDQDFFTMVGMEHPELFHVLDCTWNRQLCTWWRDHGYSDVFDQYFQCDGEVKIYHGNCNTPIPED
ncbi:PREDICTED: xyloside xylosyltransferase 1 [Leptosomus discolor]|uniref:xyloside xylosyltransferase 1 n=1 Tax=Leptosomus discolor TaxID=188344 RepID=UPI000522617D|nr:PREDICTED: xyloside xylosyltransferase 1 [Leptosomus discolor]